MTQIQSGQSIAALKEEAKRNEAFKAVAYKLALRQRARKKVTLSNLKFVMEKEGFKFPNESYEKVLSFLAKLGFGKLIQDSKGSVVALDEIQIKLQDIGKAAISDQQMLPKIKIKSEFKPLKPVAEVPILPVPPKPTYPVTVQVVIHGTPVTFGGPYKLTPDNIGIFISKINKLAESFE